MTTQPVNVHHDIGKATYNKGKYPVITEGCAIRTLTETEKLCEASADVA